MSKRRTMATIPEPYAELGSLHASVVALKELVEELTAQRGNRDDSAVTWGELPSRLTPVEGVWTPTLVPAAGAFGGITYDPSYCHGRFWKHGKKVDLWFELSWSGWTVGSASSLVNVGGIPFKAGAGLPPNGYWPGGNISYSGGPTQNPVSGLLAANATAINLYWLNAGQSNNFVTTSMIAAGHIWGSFSYLTDQ